MSGDIQGEAEKVTTFGLCLSMKSYKCYEERNKLCSI